MDKKPRLRAPNFTQSENLLLCEIVAKYQRILENKKTDGASLQQKQKAWLGVQNEYNSSTTGFSRTAESLQNTYKNLKKKAKKNASAQKMDIMGTGGGPSSNIDKDPVLEKVKVLAGPVLDGVYTIYDGDSSLMATQNIPPIEIHNIVESVELDIQETQDPADGQNNETSYFTNDRANLKKTQDPVDGQDNETSYFTNDRANLKKKPHHLLTRKRKPETETKQTVSDKFKLLATEKMELVELQKELVRTQLQEEQDQAEHNRMLRAMEIEDAEKKYTHNEKLREMEMEEMKSRYEFNEQMRRF